MIVVGLMGFCQQSCLLTYALWSGSHDSTRVTRTVVGHGDGVASGVWANEDRQLGIAFATNDQPDRALAMSIGWEGFPANELHQALGSEMVESVQRIEIRDEVTEAGDQCTFSIAVLLRPLEGLATDEPWVDDGGEWLSMDNEIAQEGDIAALETGFSPTRRPLAKLLADREIVPDRAAVTWRFRDALGRRWDGIDASASPGAPVPGTVAIRVSPVAGRPPFDPFVVIVPCDLAATARFFSLDSGRATHSNECQLTWRGQLDHHLGATEAEVASLQSLIAFAKPVEFHWTLTENDITTDVGAMFANGARWVFTPVTVAIDIVLLPVYVIVLMAVM